MEPESLGLNSLLMGKFKKYFAIYIVFILLLGSFAAGLFIGRGRRPENPEVGWQIFNSIIEGDEAKPEEVDFSLFWQVWGVIEDKYTNGPLDYEEMVYGAIRGMVDSLGDPYTVFMPPDEAEEFAQEMEGRFEGIGAEIGIRDDMLTIIAPLADSPAERAGLQAQDVILKIDDYETMGINLFEAVNRIRGEKGTEVVLKIMREGTEDPFDVTVVRDEITVKSITWQTIDENIALIELSRFGDDTEGDFKKITNEIIASDPRGIILDLRNNPGGYLLTAVKVASEFVPKKEVVAYQEFAGGKREEFTSKGPARLRDFPLVVLINEGSASASEILGGALQDYGQAKLVGQKSFGKGSVQELNEFANGSKVRVTVAKWLTPSERNIHDQGIAPDVEVELTREDISAGQDPQLDKAIEMLTNGE